VRIVTPAKGYEDKMLTPAEPPTKKAETEKPEATQISPSSTAPALPEATKADRGKADK
jgi:hypothetical protein